jgi:hypothetical protein
MVCNKLRRIGEGCWLKDGSTDWLGADSKSGCEGLELWRSKWCVHCTARMFVVLPNLNSCRLRVGALWSEPSFC